jgi:hypothetical protein
MLAACEAECTEEEKIEAKALIERCYKINDTRVRIVHGMWHPSDRSTYEAFHMSRQSLKVTTYFKDPDELERAVDECFQLAQRIIPFPGTSLYRQRQTRSAATT